MLARLDPERLERIWFPLGDQSKEETRAEATRAGLAVASRAESQEACFLGGDDYRTFLERRGLDPTPGSIVDEKGTEVGRHNGHWRYTPGQRRGLGVGTGAPVYALRTDPVRNAVVVGPREALARRRVRVEGRLYTDVEHAEAKLRYRSPAAPARVEPRRRGFTLELEQPVYGVAPGQTAVLYAGDAVVGAGLITAAV